MKNFLIDMMPIKRGKMWIVSVCNEHDQLDSEYRFSTKKDAQLFIDGWVSCVETHNRD